MRLVFLGPPGAGKGTQAKQLASARGLLHLSTGDMLRDAIAKGTPTGKKAREFVDKGFLVPDEVVDALVAERLAGKDAGKGWILDGYPRNKSQAEALRRLGAELSGVLYLHVDDERLVKRISGRRSCPKCGAVYHLEAKPPKTAGACDACGTALVQRKDDEEKVVRDRLEVYHRNTAPLVRFYEEAGLLRRIDGDRPIDTVSAAIAKAAGDVAA